MTVRHLRRPRIVFVLAVVAGSIVATGGPFPARSAADTVSPQAQVVLQGEGSWDPMGEMTAWQNDLYGSAGAINFNYLATGGFAGRQDFLAGGLDYVISGVPFTSDELATLPHGSDDLIDAPVDVSALAVMVSRPSQTLDHPGLVDYRQVCDPDNPPDPLPPGLNEPSQCANVIPFTGPIKLPANNLAAMLLRLSVGAHGPSFWDNPDVLSTLGLTVSDPSDFMGGTEDVLIPQSTAPSSFLRSEPSETNYFVQQYASTAAPVTWEALQNVFRTRFGPITERLAPGISVNTRPGVDQIITAFEGASSSGLNNPGYLAAVPPWGLTHEQNDVPKVPAGWVQVQNGAGEWVAPSPSSISAAVDAGGDTPMYALGHTVPGAYPIVWVDHLYAPSHGLPIDKTEALATTIRYLATAGQAPSITASVGDGRLSANLVAKALAAANQLVKSNCTGAGATILTNSDPGPLAPSLKTLTGLGSMLHCVPTPAATATSTTVAPARASNSPVAAGGLSIGTTGSGLGDAGLVPDLAAPTDAAGAAAAGAAAAPAAPAAQLPLVNSVVALSKLPLPDPPSGSGQFDRFTAFVVGAVLLLLARKPARSIAKALRT